MKRYGRPNRMELSGPKGLGNRSWLGYGLLAAALLFISSCTQLNKPSPEPFFALTAPPMKQEFRWSNGKLPKTFDPALASAAPETDVVRAVYEGLTETDPITLNEIAGAAESWAAKDGFKTWTFKLRKEAKWTNGKPVTAHDFVRSWKRLIATGKKAAHRSLLVNIKGAIPPEDVEQTLPSYPDEATTASNSSTSSPSMVQQLQNPSVNANTNANTNSNTSPNVNQKQNTAKAEPAISAADDHTLVVELHLPDKDFAKLVANPIFRPVFNDDEDLGRIDTGAKLVTNGPFKIVSSGKEGVVLGRSDSYWKKEAVRLERIHLIPMENAEKALDAYRAGDLDAVTNTSFSPVVLKLLSPYEDFRKTTYGALNFYDINSDRPPFSDRRVRQALSNAIERERLTEGEMEGLTRPAQSFLPFGTRTKTKLTQDKEKAKDLLEEAGFPDGKGFPKFKLLINRNDTQGRIARSVIEMWRQTLNLEAELVVKDSSDLEAARKSGDYDIVRRGVVFPSADETANFMAVFEADPLKAAEQKTSETISDPSKKPEETAVTGAVDEVTGSNGEDVDVLLAQNLILNEEDALYELKAIPLYFPTSFSLVKPYVSGFEANSLDAPLLSRVMIDSDWQPKKAGS